jgi:hypothetical protein
MYYRRKGKIMPNIHNRLELSDTVSVVCKPLDKSQLRPDESVKLGWWESRFWRPIKTIDGSTVLVSINSVKEALHLSRKDAKDLLAGGHQDFLKAMVIEVKPIEGIPDGIVQAAQNIVIQQLPHEAQNIRQHGGGRLGDVVILDHTHTFIPSHDIFYVWVNQIGDACLVYKDKTFVLETGENISFTKTTLFP